MKNAFWILLAAGGLIAFGACIDPAMEPAKIVTDPGPDYAPSSRKWQGIPSLERSRKGRLWAAWYSGGDNEGPYNYVQLVTSGDDGKTWSQPKVAVDPYWLVRAYDPCVWIDPQGRLWLFWAQAVVQWDGRGGVWGIMADDAESENPHWTAPRRFANGVMLNKPTVLESGEWLLPIAGWKNIPSRIAQRKVDLEPLRLDQILFDIGEEKGSNVYSTTDGMQTVRRVGQAQIPDSKFDEHMIVERRDRSLWMLVRAAYGIGQSVSTDRGRTWSAGEPSGIAHINSRFFVRRLQSGNLLLVHNVPPDHKGRSHLTASLSEDDGKTWIGNLMLDDRNSVSYPDGVQAADGRIYITYDRDRTHAKEILMTVIREEDVRRGSAPQGRLREIINKGE